MEKTNGQIPKIGRCTQKKDRRNRTVDGCNKKTDRDTHRRKADTFH